MTALTNATSLVCVQCHLFSLRNHIISPPHSTSSFFPTSIRVLPRYHTLWVVPALYPIMTRIVWPCPAKNWKKANAKKGANLQRSISAFRIHGLVCVYIYISWKRTLKSPLSGSDISLLALKCYFVWVLMEYTGSTHNAAPEGVEGPLLNAHE